MSKIEVHATVRGHVQGVGFRWVAQSAARRLGLVGTVRNMADGTVEIVVQGEGERVSQFFDDLGHPGYPARVDAIDKEESLPTTLFRDFQILF